MNTSKYILYVGEGDEVSAEDLMSEIKAAAQGSFVQFRPTTKEDILSMDNPDEFFDLQDNDWEDCLDMYIPTGLVRESASVNQHPVVGGL